METEIRYMARSPVLDVEKAFTTDFPIDHVAGAENMRTRNVDPDDQRVIVDEITDRNQWKMDVHGFCFLKAEIDIDLEELYKNRKGAQGTIWHEVEAVLHQHFPHYSRIEAFDLTVRKRDPAYPSQNRGYNPLYENPSRGAHADFSQQGGFLVLQHCFPGQDDYWKERDFDIINVWRPLRGTTDDWPLAMCDYTTIDKDNDLLLNDSIKRDLVVECSLMHYNEAHRWYYLKDQQLDDLLVFRNSDSSGKRARGFHAAVCNPRSTGPERESIEVRLVAFH